MMNDPLLGQTIGNYQIQGRLGKGGMATVYRARQLNMQRDVAIKIMSADLAEDPQFVARFEREARVIANLQHPRILPVHDFGHDGDIFYLVMRLVEGESLYHRLLQGPLTLGKASKYLSQIAEALDYAHAQGVVHRDLKPNNVLIDAWDNLYLMDFGLAKMLAASQSLTQTGTVLGTPAYMAPEQWRSGAVDARTDVYSLGVIVYEMVLGHTPFESDTPFTLMYKHLNDPPPPLRESMPDLPQAVEDVIFKALAKDHDERYASAGELAQAFAEVVRVAGSLVLKERLPSARALPADAEPVEADAEVDEVAAEDLEAAADQVSEEALPAEVEEFVPYPAEIIPPPPHIAAPPPPIPVRKARPGDEIGGAPDPRARARQAAYDRPRPASPPPSAMRDQVDREASSGALQQMLEAVDQSVEAAIEKVAQSMVALNVTHARSTMPTGAPAFAQVSALLAPDEPVVGVLDVRGTTRWHRSKRLLAAGIVLFMFGVITQAGGFTLFGLIALGYLGYKTYRTWRGDIGRFYLGFTPERVVLLPRSGDDVPEPDDAYLAAWSDVERLRLTSRYVLLDFPLDDGKTLHFGALLMAEGGGGLGDQTLWLPNSPITALVAERGFEVREM